MWILFPTGRSALWSNRHEDARSAWERYSEALRLAALLLVALPSSTQGTVLQQAFAKSVEGPSCKGARLG